MKLNKILQAELDSSKAPLASTGLEVVHELAGHDLPEDYRAFLLRFGPVYLGDDGTEFRYEYRDTDGMITVETNSLAELYHPDAMRRMVQQSRGFYLGDVVEYMLIIGATPNGDPIFMGFGAQDGIWFPIGHNDDGVWNPDEGGLLIKIGDSFTSFLQQLF